MCHSGRLFNCARCHQQVIICSHCDRGHRYCSGQCAQLSRKEKLKEARLRYDKKQQARLLKSRRQKRYRQRKKEKATHQGSRGLCLYDLLLIELEKLKKRVKKLHFTDCTEQCCHFCGVQCSEYLRFAFLQQRETASFSVFTHQSFS